MAFAPSDYQPLFTGGHLLTLCAWARPRTFPRLPPPETRYFDVASDARVLAHCHWQEQRSDRPALVVLHGLEGSSRAHYMSGLADKAWAAGWSVVRLNQRNCGGTEHLSRGLYHSGLTHDLRFVIEELIARDRVPALAAAGYSLGGNLALKLAGELGADAPSELKAICAVSPTMDLARCVEALERCSNIVYQWNFVRNLKARMRRKAAAFPDLYSLEALPRVWSVRSFDETYTAPYHGFRDATDYYHRASAMRVVDRIRVPTLVVTAEDDPFVPIEPFRDPVVTGNANLAAIVTRHGGHCAYLARGDGEYDGYWVEREIVRFVSHHAGPIPPTRPARPSTSEQTPDPSLLLRA